MCCGWCRTARRRSARPARVLQPGARFALTNWDRDLAPPGTPPPVPDHRPLLQAAGFAIETYSKEIPEAEAKRRVIYERYIASREALHREIGAAGARAPGWHRLSAA